MFQFIEIHVFLHSIKMNRNDVPDSLVDLAVSVGIAGCVDDALGNIGDEDGVFERLLALVPQRYSSPLTTPEGSVVRQETVFLAVHVRRAENHSLRKLFPHSHFA